MEVSSRVPSPPNAGSPLKASILIVDDTPANLLAFDNLLSELGHTVVAAKSGTDALGYALVQEFAVILMDVRMPRMDGIETAELLRKRERTRHTPIIFMSAYESTPVLVSQAYIAGAIDYLFSPVNADILKFKVSMFIDLHLKQERQRTRIVELEAQLIESRRSEERLRHELEAHKSSRKSPDLC